MKITLQRQPRWRVEVEGYPTIETEELSPLHLYQLGNVIAARVHEGVDELSISIAMLNGVDHEAVEQVRTYIENVHYHALARRRVREGEVTDGAA